jgi:uncharacterized SAM-binding protein YcdF (DUF218 family)
MTERAEYIAQLATGPLMAADAIVILAGEDAEPRVAAALELFRQNAAPICVITGGLSQPPRIRDAKFCKEKLVGFGVSPTRLIVDRTAMHTRAQADVVIALAQGRGWKRILVVASPYHIFRAHLTFVQALLDAGLADTLRVVMVPASQSRWNVEVEGATDTRSMLFRRELAKIDEYLSLGHVAPYAAGLAYLRRWELTKVDDAA